MGLDFRTNNKENIPILAAEDGYISRILISHNGYGKALYIHHPHLNLTTVYAHLNQFAPAIENWTNEMQYRREINTIDTNLPPHLFKIIKGEKIALSGNTGSSSGPHLHFEIRSLQTEKTINPLHYYPQIVDQTTPTLSKIIIYKIANQQSSVLEYISPIEDKNKHFELAAEKVGIAVSSFDKMNGSPNTFGIYALRVFEDDVLKYQFKLDSLDFNWQSHIKASSDYGLPYSDIYKGYHESCSFHLTDSGSANGYIMLNPKKKLIRIEVSDFSGNTARTSFSLSKHPSYSEEVSKTQPCQLPILLSQQNIAIEIPAYGLSENFSGQVKLSSTINSNEIARIQLLTESSAVLKPYKLIYKADKRENKSTKIFIESRVDNKHKAYFGQWNGNNLVFPKIKNFGTLILKYDQTPPTISAPIKTKTQLFFTIDDRESEILSYKLTIDGKWRKLYYDAKTHKIIYNILPEDKSKKVNAIIEVADGVGNKKMKTVEILL